MSLVVVVVVVVRAAHSHRWLSCLADVASSVCRCSLPALPAAALCSGVAVRRSGRHGQNRIRKLLLYVTQTELTARIAAQRGQAAISRSGSVRLGASREWRGVGLSIGVEVGVRSSPCNDFCNFVLFHCRLPQGRCRASRKQWSAAAATRFAAGRSGVAFKRQIKRFLFLHLQRSCSREHCAVSPLHLVLPTVPFRRLAAWRRRSAILIQPSRSTRI